MGLSKAYLKPEKGEKIPFLYNPSKYTVTKANSWQPPGGVSKTEEGTSSVVTGKSAPDLEYKGGQPGTIAMDIILDTTAEGVAVTKYTNQLFKLMDVDTTLPGYDATLNNGRPPWVRFFWGKLSSFKAIIESLSVSFTYFTNLGDPIRAETSLSLKQLEEDPKLVMQNPTSGTPRPHAVHLVQAGETLDRISARHYGTSRGWRAIARANQIVDPLRIRPGTLLAIPDLREGDRG